MKCVRCDQDLGESKIGFNDYCTKCHHDTHTCVQCLHYDLAYNNGCRESQADRVVDKEKRNHCDYFSPKDGLAKSGPSKNDLLSAAEALFKKK